MQIENPQNANAILISLCSLFHSIWISAASQTHANDEIMNVKYVSQLFFHFNTSSCFSFFIETSSNSKVERKKNY